MNTKIILISPSGTETLVATFEPTSFPIEAFQCAALLQAIHGEDKADRYWVEFKFKGKLKRLQPERLMVTVGNIKTLYDAIRCCFIPA